MKNILLKLFVIVIALNTISCDDELRDLQPFTEVNPQLFLKNPKAFRYAVDGVYSQLWNYYSNSNSGLQGIPDILSDNVIQDQSGRNSNDDYYDFRYVASTGGPISLYWSEAYEAINAANVIISQIDNLPNGATKNNILGETLAARAWAHFDLVKFYAKIPTQSSDANSSLGIIYIKVEDGDTKDVLAKPSRETVGDNYKEIIADLERARELIGMNNGEGRLDMDGVNALLSRVYLYNGNYEKVIESSNKVSKKLATSKELPGVYTDSTNAGILIELSVNTKTEANFNNVGVLYSQSNAKSIINEYVIDFEFYNNIPKEDIRKDIISFEGTNSKNVKFNSIKKFLGEAGQINGLVDIKVLRAEEVLLNKIEAQFELGQTSLALEGLNQLRDLRFTSYKGGELGADLEKAIQFNRRVELCFEGHRFFDIKRRGEDLIRSSNGEVIDGTGTAPVVKVLKADNFRFQMPIPLQEINANSNIKQNPGY